MKKQILALLLALLIAIAATACGQSKTAPVDSADPVTSTDQTGDADIKFAFVFGMGGPGDNGFNDECNEGCQMAVDQYGVSYDFCEPTDIADYETQLRAYADTGEYDVIFSNSSDMVDIVEMVAEDYPAQRFCMLDSAIDGYDNIHSLTASQPEQHFLSGVLAGLATQDDRFPLANDDNILGFCIAMDIPVSNAQAAGFLAGARYINPDVEIITTYIGGYNDPATAKEQAITMYERGADIVGTNSGSSATGVFSAASELDQYVIGTSLSMVDADHSLCTSLKYMQAFVLAEVKSLVEGTWEPGVDVYGIKDGVCDYTLEGVNTEIPQDVIDTIEEIKVLVSDGTLVLPTTIDELDAWAAANIYQG